MDLDYLTDGLPGTGGNLKRAPEDFRVDEIPLYLPSGEGEHVFFHVWKRGLATFEAVRRIADALGVPERAVSYAGLKDARAVTTQWMSVFGVEEEAVHRLAVPGVSILRISRHGNRLKIGHLRGNRFTIRVRDPAAAGHAAPILDRLVRRGAPNYFGEQRFGTRGNSHRCGEKLLRKDYAGFVRELLGGPPTGEADPRLAESRAHFDAGRIDEAYAAMPTKHRAEKKCLHALLRFDADPERAFFSIPKRLRQMFAAAFQSSLFNRLLHERLATCDRLEDGDLAYLHRNGAVFRVDDAAVEQRRCAAWEISPSGPIFGTKSLLAGGAPGARERAVLEGTGLALEDFAVGGGLRLPGGRRSFRIPVREAALAPEEDGYSIAFRLPPGCFATSVLREIMKPGRL